MSSSVVYHQMDEAKALVADLICSVLTEKFAVTLEPKEFCKQFTKPKEELGDVAVPCFQLTKLTKLPPPKAAAELAVALNEKLSANTDTYSYISKVIAAGPFLNVTLSTLYLAQVIPRILDNSYLAPMSQNGKDRVMIEYSQPNTHKAFHVGHMRNCAIGDSLVRLYEQIGHPVVAVNYFGDEGAHVSKCLWYLRNKVEQSKLDIDTIEVEKRAEWLGDCYSKAVELLEPKNYTKYPFPGVITAKVVSMEKHPHPEAPANWNRLKLEIGKEEQMEVVCGGMGYNVGDIVAYLPVGAKLNKKMGVVGVADKMGVNSYGVVLAEKELGLGEDKEEEKKEENKEEKKAAPAKKDNKKGGEEKKTGGDAKTAGKKPAPAANMQIMVLPAGTEVGQTLAEIGRLPDTDIPSNVSVLDELAKRKAEVGTVLQGLEHGDKELCALWDKTKIWSLDEFKKIYSWLNCRFDHDFTESEVSEPSQKMMKEWAEQNKVIKKDGATGMDLSAHNLGFAVLLKSDGTGLYATKDLALAVKKFEQFKVDKSIYVVDAAQTYHFQQVFKCLELAGYEQAKKCTHIPYGLVVLPEGKMSSRKGTVIFFSTLQKMLKDTIMANFLSNKEAEWSKEEVEHALRAIAVATIKYGMLNHDKEKDIVFELNSWAHHTGDTGPYLLYAYTRIKSIGRKVALDASSNPVIDYKHLTHFSEKMLLLQLHKFWDVINHATQANNPSILCTYLFETCQLFSKWYEQVRLANETDQSVLATKLEFLKAVSLVLQKGLNLLGISTLERM